MALYLGSNKQKLYLDGVLYNAKLFIDKPINNGRLLSYDNYTLKDSNGLYLIAKEDK